MLERNKRSFTKKGTYLIGNQSSSCQHKGTTTLKRNALIGTIVPQAIKKDQNDKRGTIPLGTPVPRPLI